ncbi:hypothetical protein [Arthrobacter gengyunqii]|uniref:WXG100 family type VII secretion target n=1 Tax=Arthrobacter gengyunqii TaxID=2886940 RepID=A0ABS8GH02_9MICC|nr:hypothetical protein [Arthrobacter gengyunqii]MCC3265685.1 hypothetical protein [Arthrobacter gengyunqii]
MRLPHIDVPWDELEDSAADMVLRARTTADYLVDAAAAWDRFRDYYHHPATQDQIYAALAELKEPTENWQRSLQDAAVTISAFAAAGRVLARQAQDLQEAFGQLGPQETGEEGAAQDSAEQQLDDQAATLVRRWADLQERTAAALAEIRYGQGAGLPMGAAPGGNILPAVGWSALTGKLDQRFGTLNPDALLPSLLGLNEAELREWGAANPEAAALLANRELAGAFWQHRPEAIMQKAMAGGAHLTQDGIAGIRDAWLSLSQQDQERLLLLYPGVFGSLNGVPFAQRARSNLITVAGLQQNLREKLAGLREPVRDDYQDWGVAADRWQAAHDQWNAQREHLEEKLKGLDYAVAENVQVVMVSLEDNGQIVTMTGQPSADTKIMGALVPGTGARLGELEAYLKRLEAISDGPGADTLGFYWQGTNLPQDVVWDNTSPVYNEAGAPLLAAFDYAVDLELPAGARTTYVGYSAGGSLLGTGERVGLDSTNIVYVAQAGPGHEVSSPGDTANPQANRYAIQTRSDLLIIGAQGVGGAAHGGSFWEGGGVGRMGAVRLESGFRDPLIADSLMGGHMDYFGRGSTAAENIKGVINGGEVSLFIEDVWYSTADGGFYVSPIELRPQDYIGNRMETVNVLDLEQ